MKHPLTSKQVAEITAPGLYAVGGCPGLSVQITPPAGRSWVLRFLRNGKRVEMGLGPCAEVSLEDARKLGLKARRELREGDDPIARLRHRRQEIGDVARMHARLSEAEEGHQRLLISIMEQFDSPTERADALEEVAAVLVELRDWLKKRVLTDSYVRRRMIEEGWPPYSITRQLISVKRQNLTIKRFLKEKAQ